MTREEIYLAWAPLRSTWQPWVKPVLFTQMGSSAGEVIAGEPEASLTLPSFRADTAVVVDFPGEQSVAVGLSLAQMGYCPVPLFNACPAPLGTPTVVNVRPTIAALVAGAPMLMNLRLPDDAPPVFLLDAHRRIGVAFPTPGTFDNRSISLPTDFPSANLLLSRGIRNVVLISLDAAIEADLTHTLLRWQQAGIAILNNGAPQQRLTIKRPSHFRSLLHNMLSMLGLRRNPLGGFGGRLPLGGGVG